MELSSLNFVVKNFCEITLNEKEFLVEAYRKLFIKMYGIDVVDAFTCVTKINTKELVNEDYQVKALSKNYNRAIEVLESLEDNPNNKLLLIYLDNNLIGSAYLKRIEESVSSIPFIVIESVEKKVERYIWKETVYFIEKYFRKKGYKKMYLEIPLKEGPLLVRANDLGFKEDPEDIIIDEEVYTYILNKKLEGSNDAK